MLSQEIKDKLIKMVTEELDWCGLYINKPERTYLYSPVDDEERYYDYFHWNIGCGASKLVLFPPNMDYVIKIPFNGFHIDFEVYEDAYYEKNPVPSMLASCFDYEAMTEQLLEKFNDEDDSVVFDPFTRASYDGSTSEWDYCETECFLSEAAAEYGLEDIFMPTEWLFDYHGYPIYVQKKCEVEAGFDVSEYSCSDEDRRTVRQLYKQDCLGYLERTSWLASAYVEYGEDKVNKLIKFIEEYNICDLRDENRGLYKGKPVLIDYCSFRE